MVWRPHPGAPFEPIPEEVLADMDEGKQVTEELEHSERTVITEEAPPVHDADLPEPGVETPVQGVPDADEVRADPHDEVTSGA